MFTIMGVKLLIVDFETWGGDLNMQFILWQNLSL